jgi:hypothetical protein
MDAPTKFGAPGRGAVFIFVSFLDLCSVDDSVSLAPWPCLREETVWPALATGIPTPAKAGAAVITLRHCEENRGIAVHCQQDRHGPAQGVQAPPGVALATVKKRASKCILEEPLAIEPGPIAVVGRRAGADGPVGVTPEPTPGNGALCMKQASTTSWLVAILDIWCK